MASAYEKYVKKASLHWRSNVLPEGTELYVVVIRRLLGDRASEVILVNDYWSAMILRSVLDNVERVYKAVLLEPEIEIVAEVNMKALQWKGVIESAYGWEMFVDAYVDQSEWKQKELLEDGIRPTFLGLTYDPTGGGFGSFAREVLKFLVPLESSFWTRPELYAEGFYEYEDVPMYTKNDAYNWMIGAHPQLQGVPLDNLIPSPVYRDYRTLILEGEGPFTAVTALEFGRHAIDVVAGRRKIVAKRIRGRGR